jgi:hypothetical protein
LVVLSHQRSEIEIEGNTHETLLTLPLSFALGESLLLAIVLRAERWSGDGNDRPLHASKFIVGALSVSLPDVSFNFSYVLLGLRCLWRFWVNMVAGTLRCTRQVVGSGTWQTLCAILRSGACAAHPTHMFAPSRK